MANCGWYGPAGSDCCVICPGYGSLPTYTDGFDGTFSGWYVTPSIWTITGSQLVGKAFGDLLYNRFYCTTTTSDMVIDTEANMRTADAPNSGDYLHNPFYGILGSVNQRFAGFAINNSLSGGTTGTHEYSVTAILDGTSPTTVVSTTSAPGSHTLRLVVELVPLSSPATLSYKYYVDASLATTKTKTVTASNTAAFSDLCDIRVGYNGSQTAPGELVSDPPAASFEQFKSDYFTCTVTS